MEGVKVNPLFYFLVVAGDWGLGIGDWVKILFVSSSLPRELCKVNSSKKNLFLPRSSPGGKPSLRLLPLLALAQQFWVGELLGCIIY